MVRLLALLLAMGLALPLIARAEGLQPRIMRTAVRSTPAPLDRLVSVLAERLAVSRQVAAAKWINGAPIDDPVRETALLDDVARQAGEVGVDPDWAKAVFAAQFEASKHLQRRLHEAWRTSGRGLVGPAPDLAREVRPAMDRLTPELLAALRDAAPALARHGAAKRLRSVAEPFAVGEGLDEEVWRLALAPLAH